MTVHNQKLCLEAVHIIYIGQYRKDNSQKSDGLKKFIDYYVDCVVNFAIREGEPTLDLEFKTGDHICTPIQVKQLKPLLHVPLEPFQRHENIPVSQLLWIWMICSTVVVI